MIIDMIIISNKNAMKAVGVKNLREEWKEKNLIIKCGRTLKFRKLKCFVVFFSHTQKVDDSHVVPLNLKSTKRNINYEKWAINDEETV